MNYFHYQAEGLCAEQISIDQIVKQFGTPCYIYSRAALVENWRAFDHAFKAFNHQVCYAVKANSNLAILNILARLGSGFDIVSGGELARVLAAGGKPDKILFSGVGKTEAEIQTALEVGIYCFNVESKAELDRINTTAKKLKTKANIALRINPDLDVQTHPYISTALKENKFGVPIEDALDLYEYAISLPHIQPIGIACHLGSQIMSIEPFMTMVEKLLEIIPVLKKLGVNLEHIDLGGGLGVCYHDEKPPSFDEYATAILAKLKQQTCKIFLEPGRALVADAGILVTKVEYLKHQATKNFAVVDAAMNDLLRPALYDAWHGIIPVKPRTEGLLQIYDVVGPVCETSDFLGKNHHLRVVEGDLLAICTVGAYGFAMSSNYNSRPRVAEVLVDKDRCMLVRKRETINELFADEQVWHEK